MAEIPNERTQAAADLAAAARDRGMEHLEGAKGQLAEGAERVAAAVERTADELDGDGDETLSGFGHSVASLMRQLAGGLRERDVEEFARELGTLARRNPGVFLAGSVAVGFGIARFFKARAPRSTSPRDYRSRDSAGWQEGDAELRRRADFDGDDTLDLSASSTSMPSSDDAAKPDTAPQAQASADDGTAAQQTATTDDEGAQATSRSSSKQPKRGGKP